MAKAITQIRIRMVSGDLIELDLENRVEGKTSHEYAVEFQKKIKGHSTITTQGTLIFVRHIEWVDFI